MIPRLHTWWSCAHTLVRSTSDSHALCVITYSPFLPCTNDKTRKPFGANKNDDRYMYTCDPQMHRSQERTKAYRGLDLNGATRLSDVH